MIGRRVRFSLSCSRLLQSAGLRLSEATMQRTAFVYDERFLDHDTGDRFVENGRRLTVTMDYLQRQPWFADMLQVDARRVERRWLEAIHESQFIDTARTLCEAGARNLNDPDVRVCPKSYEIALLASGGALQLADSVMNGEADNGFALLRPPGHHAESDRAMGFCMFNNVAIAARYLQSQYNVEKVMILDWDVHHGNGTQHSFEHDPSVLFISLHQYPLYPGTGSYSETGIGPGANATLNCPMSPGSGDEQYMAAFSEKVLPAAEDFKPDAVILSAGFDAHAADPLAQINLTSEFYGWMTARIMEIADKYAGGRIISMLEGGYSLEALPLCVAAHLRTLIGAGSAEASGD